MIDGHVFLTDDGMNLANVDESKRDSVVQNFCEMRKKKCPFWKDHFYVSYDFYSSDLYKHLTENPFFWKGVSSISIQNFQQDFGNYPEVINYLEFIEKFGQKTQGGFEYEGHPAENYIYDCATLEEWHNYWNREFINCVTWENEIFPYKSQNINIMKAELKKITENSANYSPLERKDIFRVQNNNYKDDNDVVNCFHNLIVKHKSASSERIAYVKIMGEKICKCNGYHREQELERLEEKEDGNNHAERIYSIKKKNGEFIFLCIDKQHGMLELCDDKGDHQGEVRFDGSLNKTAKPDHGLKCVAEWKRLNNR